MLSHRSDLTLSSIARSSQSLSKSSEPPTSYLHHLISVQPPRSTRSSSLVTATNIILVTNSETSVEPQMNVLLARDEMHTSAPKQQYAKRCHGKSETSHFCQIVEKFPRVGDKISMLYCSAETARNRTQTVSVIGWPKNSE